MGHRPAPPAPSRRRAAAAAPPPPRPRRTCTNAPSARNAALSAAKAVLGARHAPHRAGRRVARARGASAVAQARHGHARGQPVEHREGRGEPSVRRRPAGAGRRPGSRCGSTSPADGPAGSGSCGEGERRLDERCHAREPPLLQLRRREAELRKARDAARAQRPAATPAPPRHRWPAKARCAAT